MKSVTAGRVHNPVLAATLLAAGMFSWSPLSQADPGMSAFNLVAPFRQQRAEPGFLTANPIAEHHHRRWRIGIQYTLRLPSGAIATHAPAWSAETHTAGNLSADYWVPGFSVPSLHGSWDSSTRKWRLSAWVTDITKENLFTNIADLSTTDANRLQQWPDRHWWFSLERRF